MRSVFFNIYLFQIKNSIASRELIKNVLKEDVVFKMTKNLEHQLKEVRIFY